jgi:hypothetical protein
MITREDQDMRKNKYYTLALCMAFLAIILLPHFQGVDIVVSENTTSLHHSVNLGKMTNLDHITKKVSISNTSPRDLRILSIKPSCGCAALFPNFHTLNSNSDDHFTIQYNALGKIGKQEESIQILLNDGINITLYLTIQIQPDIETDPKFIAFTNDGLEDQVKQVQFTKIKNKKMVIKEITKSPGLDLSVAEGDTIRENETIHIIKPAQVTLPPRISTLEIIGTHGEQVKLVIETINEQTITVEPEYSCLRYYSVEEVIHHNITVLRDPSHAEIEIRCDNPAVTLLNDNNQYTNPQGLLVDTYTLIVDCQKLEGDYQSKITVTSGSAQEIYDLYIIQEG